MKYISKYLSPTVCVFCILISSNNSSAQDLDPRAYARVPVDFTFVVAGFGYTYGSVVTDPTLPLQDLKAKVETPVIAAGHSFSLFGLTSTAYVSLPYTWAQLSGKLIGEDTSATRSGLSDMKFRLSVLLLGSPAATVEELMKAENNIILGASLTLITPTGQFFPDKLINIGTNRWSFKPEIGLSYPITQKWFFDFYAGVWFFTDNSSFYPGKSVRSQNPLGSFQAHLSYNVNPLMWAALDLTYYTGGQSSVNDVYNNDVQNNVRVGATLNVPLSRRNSIKLAYSTGAIIRFSANFSTLSIAWQTAFF